MRVIIADQRELSREALGALLRTRADLVVVGAVDARGAAEAVGELSPAVLVLGIGADEHDTAVKRIRVLCRQQPSLRIVSLVPDDDPIYVEAVLDAGSSACLSPRSSVAELMEAILRPRRANGSITTVHRRGPLSARERQVLRLIARGRSNRAIGQDLSIAEGTVKRHTHSIYRKLGVSSRVDAINRATLIGLIGRTGP